jgi:predicted Zn-dependent protease
LRIARIHNPQSLIRNGEAEGQPAMNEAKLNTRLLLRAGVAVAGLAVATHLVHGWQVRRHARAQLDRAEEARSEARHADEVAALGRYLAFAPGNHEVRARHALTLAEQAASPQQRWRALEVLRGALAREPANLELRQALVETALALSRHEEAHKHLVVLLARTAKELDRRALLARRAECEEAAGDLARAAATWQEASRADPSDAQAPARLASLLRTRLEQPKRADAVLDDLVKRNPRSPAAWQARALDRRAVGRLDDAAADLERACRLAPVDRDLLLLAAAVARGRARTTDAAARYAEVLRHHPGHPAAYLARATLALDAGQLAEATSWLRKGLRRVPGNLDLIFALADGLFQQGKEKEAQALTLRLRAAGGKLAAGRLLHLQGQRWLRRGEWAKARDALGEASRTSDVPAEMAGQTQLALAQCHRALCEPDGQFAACRQAAAFCPSSAEARHALGSLLLAAGAEAEALPHLRALVQLPGAPDDAWTLLARALVMANLRLAPADRTWSEAEAALTRAARSPGQAVPVVMLRADVLLARDDLPGARALLEQARQAHPTDVTVWRGLVELARRSGAATEALARADAALADSIAWWSGRAEELARTGSQGDADAIAALASIEQRLPAFRAADQERLARHLTESYARVGHAAGVQRLATRLLKDHPDEQRLRLLLADALLASGQRRQAWRELEEVRRREGPTGTAWRCGEAAWWLSLGQSAGRQGLDRTRALLKQAAALRPSWSHPVLLEARLDEVEGRAEEALRNYRRALALGDRSPLAITRAAQMLSRQGKYAEADRVIEDAQRQDKLPPILVRAAARIALRAGKPDRACALARLAVDARLATSYRDLLWLGRLLEDAGRPTEAEDSLRQAVRRAPDAAPTWLALVALLGRTKQSAAAEAVLVEMERALAPARRPLALAQACEALLQLDRAEQAYTRALGAAPQDTRTQREAARFYLRLGRWADAERVLVGLLAPGALLAEEELPEVRRALALVLSATGDGKSVARGLRLVEANRREEGDTVADRRVAALVRGTLPAQRAAALRELDALPGGPATRAEERFLLACLYDQAGDWGRARLHLAAVLEQDGRNPAYLARMIDALLRRNKPGEASLWLAKLAEVEPASARVRSLQDRLSRLQRQK